MSFITYSKEYNNKKMKVRKEIQEYPNKPLEDSSIDKLEDEDKTKLSHLV